MSFIGLLHFDDTHICEDCHEVYDEYHCSCPRCDGLVVKAKHCDVGGCLNYMAVGEECCFECRKEAIMVLSDALASLDPAQVKYLDNLLDGKSLLEFWREN